MDKTPQKARPQKRTLVRWTDDIDKRVLVSIQWACADSGIKIPWKKIATQLGPEFTEGAIVQHLAKLRLKMVEMEMEVPPPLKRGTVIKEPSSFYTNKNRKSPATPIKIKSEEVAQTPTRSTTRARGRTRKRAEYESDSSSNHGDKFGSDSDEYGRSSRRKRPHVNTGGMKTQQKRAFAVSKMKRDTVSNAEHSNTKTPTVKNENVSPNAENDMGPAMRTRGIRQDYAYSGNEDDEDSEEGDLTNGRAESTSGARQDNNSESDREEGQYSPRDTTNTDIYSAKSKTGTIMSVHRTSTTYSRPTFEYLSSGFPNSQDAIQVDPSMGRGNLSRPSPHSSSFSSSRTTSSNLGMLQNTHTGTVYPTVEQAFDSNLDYPGRARQRPQPNSMFNSATFTGNNDFDPYLGGDEEVFSGSLGFLNDDIDSPTE